MKEIFIELSKVLSGKDGPLIWGLTAITVLTIGWKFVDSGYEVEGNGWKVYTPNTFTKNEIPETEPNKDVTASERGEEFS